MATWSAELLELLGNLAVGDRPYGRFRGSDLAPLFARAGWIVDTPCPRTGWELWATEQLSRFHARDPRAVEKFLAAMAGPLEFLNQANRVDREEQRRQIHVWNGFLAPHGLQISLSDSGVAVDEVGARYLSADESPTPAGTVPEEVRPLVSRLHERYGSDGVFIMFQYNPGEPTRQLIATIKKSLEVRGFVGLTALDQKFSDILWRNIQAYLYGCRAGIAVFDRLESEQYNANVALEAGHMIALAKPIAFLKERTMRGLQSDLAGHIWYPFDVHSKNSVEQAVDRWLCDDGLI